MVLDYYGRYVPLEELRARAGISRDCATAGDLLRVGRELGLAGRALRAELADFPRHGFPLIAHVRFIHFVVVEGIEGGLVHLNDPGAGRHARPIEEFDQIFTGVVLTFRPTDAFVRGGAPPPLLPALARAVRPAAGLALAAAACAALQAAPTLAAALALERLGEGAGISWAPTLATATLAILVLALLREACLGRLARRLGTLHTTAVLQRLPRLAFAFFTYRLPEDLARIVRWPTRLADVFTGAPGRAGLDALAVPALLLGIARLDLAAAALVLAIGAAHVLAARTLLRSRSRRYKTRFQASGRSLAHSPDQVERCKLGGLDEELVAEVASPSARAVSVGQEDAGRQALAAAAPGLAAALALAAALGAGGLAALDGRLGPGGLLALLLLTAAVTTRAAALARDEDELDLAEDAAAALSELADLPLEARPAAASVTPRPRGPLRLLDVSFGYAAHKPPRVRGVTLEVGPGEAIGLTGPSGGGKSTIAALLVGLHRPWSGRAELGGRALEELPRELLAREVAWVHRAPLLFAGTLRDNLTLFDPTIDEGALAAAVRDACLDEVLARRPGGLEARVESRGLELSAGERQRVELARALVRDPQVLVLDEALEALQPELEARVRERLRARGVGLVVVSHRASTLAACDRVLEVRDGELRAAGAPPAPAPSARTLGPFHGGHAPSPRRAEPRGGAALRSALALVAGIEVPAAASQNAALDAAEHEPLRAMARRARLRVRRVRLVRADWWREDAGDLLAFTRDGSPRALLRRGGRYRIADPRWPDRLEPLTPEHAADLEREAYTVLPRAPDGPLSAPWLLRAGLPRARRDLLASAALAFGAGLVLASLPLATAAILRHALPFGDATLMATLSGACALAAIAAALLEAAGAIARRRAEGRLEHEAVVAAADRLVRMEPAALRRLAPGEVTRRWGGLGEALQRLWDATTPGLAALAVAGGSLVGLALLSPSLALFTLGLWLTLPLAAAAVTARALPSEARLEARSLEARLFLLDLLRGMPRLRSAAADARVAARWEGLLALELDERVRMRRLEGVQQALEDAHPLAALLALLAAFAAGVDPATLVAAALTLLLGAPAAAACARAVRAALLARQALGRFAPLVEGAVEPLAGHDPGRLRGALELEGVTLRHPGAPAPALDDVSLRIEPGRIAALVGPSGAGKTTTLRLLAGLEQPDAGAVRLDGRPLREQDVAAVRAQLGAVLQDDRLLISTLRHNVVGSAPKGLDELWAALREAGLERDVQAMPMGVQTILEDERVSSGEKQRVLLAARLLRDPRVLLLDETTSAVSEAAEGEIFRALRARGITCVVAAHRRSAIELADEVHVLERGRIVESGPPAELLARNGALTRLLGAPRALEATA